MAIKESKLIRSLCLAAAMTLMSASVVLAEDWYYNHNGSTVKLVWDEDGGDGFTVYYHNPKPGLPDYVRRGTVLFHGASPADGSLYGTAHVFSSKCGTGEYEVSGRFDDEDNDFTVSGPAPVLNQSTCEDMGLSWDSPNARLRFKYLHD